MHYFIFNACQIHSLIIILMNSPSKAYSKLKWTQEQEQLLRSLRQQNKIESWKTIANQMNQLFVQKNRSGKQCRERYMNYVRFGNNTPKTSGWTQFEDLELFEKFMQHGAKWVQIGKQMLGRSENCLKNRFYGAMRKIIRKINRTAKQKRLRQKKPIKADLLIRILEYQHKFKVGQKTQESEVSIFLDELKKQMIKIAINPEQNSSSEQIQSLITGILKFCSLVKSPVIKKGCLKKEELGSEGQQQRASEEQQDSGQKQPQQQGGTVVESKSCVKRVQNFILVSSMSMNSEKNNAGMIGGCSAFQYIRRGSQGNTQQKTNSS